MRDSTVLEEEIQIAGAFGKVVFLSDLLSVIEGFVHDGGGTADVEANEALAAGAIRGAVVQEDACILAETAHQSGLRQAQGPAVKPHEE